MGADVDLGDGTDPSNLFSNAGVVSVGLAGNANGNLQLAPTMSVVGAPAAAAIRAAGSPPAAPTIAGLAQTDITGNFVQSAGGTASPRASPS